MYYIGIDLGGTNIKGALVSETGEIAREVSRPTRVELGAEAVCDGIAAVITELSSGVDRTSLGGVGLGCPGTVDDETGRVLYANNLGWKNFDLRAAVKSRTDFDLRRRGAGRQNAHGLHRRGERAGPHGHPRGRRGMHLRTARLL